MLRDERIIGLSFDCYGTLIDWEQGIWDALQPLLLLNGGAMERAEALGCFAAIETEVQREHPSLLYEEVLIETHIRLAAVAGWKSTDALDRDFGESVARWPGFADSADALRLLARDFRLIILSNVSNSGFAHSARKLGVAFDAVYTAETIGSYKPEPRNFDYMLAALEKDHGITRDGLLHVAQSMYHDMVPAQAKGLKTAWIDRQGLASGGDWGATPKVDAGVKPDAVYPSLMDFAKAMTA